MPPEHSSPPSFPQAAAFAGWRRVRRRRHRSSWPASLTRERGNARLRDWTEKQADADGRRQPTRTPKLLSPTLDLPGRLEAFSRAPIFARVSGYLKEWKVDIGATVKAGQLLAEIDAPDLDQQLLQARADLLNMQSTAQLSEATLKRRQRSPTRA